MYVLRKLRNSGAYSFFFIECSNKYVYWVDGLIFLTEHFWFFQTLREIHFCEIFRCHKLFTGTEPFENGSFLSQFQTDKLNEAFLSLATYNHPRLLKECWCMVTPTI